MALLAATLPGIRVFVVTSVVQQLHGRLRVVIKKKESLRVEVPWASHGAGLCHRVRVAAGQSWQNAGGGEQGRRVRRQDPQLGRGGGTQDELQVPTLHSSLGLAQALLQVPTSNRTHHASS